MKSWGALDATHWNAILDALRPEIAAATSLEEAAQLVCRILATSIDKTALVRIYAILPYRELPIDVRAFVDTLATKTGQAAAILPATRVLALLGSYGRDANWQDRRLSADHKGVPLVSAAFVDAIPMLSRLLKELGIELAWLDAAPDVFTRKLLGGFNGVFYAEDATTARDAKGRLVIPATDFVESESVQTVFGMGGANPDGSVLACIVFTQERIPRPAVERLTSLISVLKAETFRAVLERKFFTPTK